jgi:hypothetical protein
MWRIEMRHIMRSLVIVILAAALLTACAGNRGGEVTPAPDLYVIDKEGLIAALNAADAVREVGEPVMQEYFSVGGANVKVRESDILVFEFDSAEVMEADATLVSSDGGSIGTTMITWISTPHFFKAGRLIVVYVGDDAEMLAQLQSLLGAQFAGR